MVVKISPTLRKLQLLPSLFQPALLHTLESSPSTYEIEKHNPRLIDQL